MSASERTIFGREVPFPMKNAYGPVVKAAIPVPGLTRWPRRANVLGRHYYGLDDEETNLLPDGAQPGKVAAFNAEAIKVVNGEDDEVSGFAGFADSLGSLGTITGPTGIQITDISQLPGGDTSSNSSSGGIDWGAIINAGIHTAPAIIQAAEGGGAPYNFYAQSVGIPGSGTSTVAGVPAGYYRNAAGQLISLASANQVAGGLGVGVAQIGNSITSFVSQNPLLVLGGLAAFMLLMMKPPSRR